MGGRRAFREIVAVARRRPAGVLVALGATLVAAWVLYLPRPVLRAPYATVLFADGGELLSARRAADGQWRFPPVPRVPDKYAAALVAFEDRRFYRHPGVDPVGLARVIREAWRSRRFSGGASTITMQVVRLSRGNPPRTVLEKVREILLALRLELHLSKSEILALHAAHAPFGGNVVGLEAGAWRYFGRPPDRLSWAEACTLAVLPNSPGLIHPGRNRDRLQAKRDRLLHRLGSEGKILALDLRLALAEPLPDRPRPWPDLAPHLVATLIHRNGLGGRRIESTVDAALQRDLTEILRERGESLQRRGIHDIAALVVDHHTFRVRAYVGNTAGVDGPRDGDAVDIVQRPRSTGSLLKPFLYAAALQEGLIAPTTLLPDVPTQYSGFRPENIDGRFRGAVPADEALSRSLNVPAVRLLRQYGVPRFYALLKGLGLSSLFRPADLYGLSLILGGAEGTLWDLTAAYANLARLAGGNEGLSVARYRQLSLSGGDSTETSRPAEFGPGAAWLTQTVLVEVARPEDEAHWQQFAHARRIAWKTGTSQGFRDAWAIGSDGRHTVGVWAGNAGGRGVAGLTGGLAAAPIFFDVFNRLGPGGWFPRPEWDLKDMDLCGDNGLRPAAGCAEVKRAVPSDSLFDRQSPHHRLIHLDPSGRWRVHSDCERVDRMVARSWFILPPAQEYYYRRRHPDYRPLPAYRADCRASAPIEADASPLDFLYPEDGARVFIPTDFGGKRGRTLFEAIHRSPGQILDWHLDGTYLGRTKVFHQQALDLAPGPHTVTIVDAAGHRLSRRFEVLGP